MAATTRSIAKATGELATRNMICFDGLGGQRVYVFPDSELVIVRTGVLDGGYEDPILPNLVSMALRGIVTRAAAGMTDPRRTPRLNCQTKFGCARQDVEQTRIGRHNSPFVVRQWIGMS